MIKKKPMTLNVYTMYIDRAQKRGMKFATMLDQCLTKELRIAQRDAHRRYYSRQGSTARYGERVRRTSVRIPIEVWEYCEMKGITKAVFIDEALRHWSKEEAIKGPRGHHPCCLHCIHYYDWADGKCDLQAGEKRDMTDLCLEYEENPE